MSPSRIDEIEGTRLAFAQGGNDGTKLLLVTPPVRIERHSRSCEVKWSPSKMPFKYRTAPLLIDNSGETDFPLLKKSLRRVNRSTFVAKFASSFRSRREPLKRELERELLFVYDKKLDDAELSDIAIYYEEALPIEPTPVLDSKRNATYKNCCARAEGWNSPRKPCRKATRSRSC